MQEQNIADAYFWADPQLDLFEPHRLKVYVIRHAKVESICVQLHLPGMDPQLTLPFNDEADAGRATDRR